MQKILIALLLFQNAYAGENYLPWGELQKNFAKVSPHSKILSHVQCFFERHRDTSFKLKMVSDQKLFNRCSFNPEITMNNQRVFAVVDYTINSGKRRMFLIDRLSGKISSMVVAHGRYKAGFFNRKLEENKNTIKEIKYYSNTINSMASSSGFYIVGQDYNASDFGRSLIIHGLERDINDNACERDVVVHSHYLVTLDKVYMLSSGCLMVSPRLIDNVIDRLKGKTGDDLKLEGGGSLLFIYGPREEKWKEGSCEGNFTLAQ